MTPEVLAARVDEIIGMDDAEEQHIYEDDLRYMLLGLYAPEWVTVEIKRLAAAPFYRWYA